MNWRPALSALVAGLGLNISCALWQPVMSDGSLVQLPNQQICLVEDDRLRQIPDLPTFDNLGFVRTDIVPITNDQLGSMKQGSPMPHLDSRLLRAPDEKIFLMVHGTRRHVINLITLNNLGLKQEPLKASDQLLAELPLGPELPVISSRLVRAPDGRVYLITSGVFRFVPDPETLKNLCVARGFADVGADFMTALPVDAPLGHSSKPCT